MQNENDTTKKGQRLDEFDEALNELNAADILA